MVRPLSINDRRKKWYKNPKAKYYSRRKTRNNAWKSYLFKQILSQKDGWSINTPLKKLWLSPSLQALSPSLDEKANLNLLFLIGLTTFAASTFLIPRLSHFFLPVATLYPYEALFSKEKTLSECAPQSLELVTLSLFCYLGAIIGLGMRCRLGPKNTSPTFPLVARIPLYTCTGFFSVIIPSFLVLYITKNSISEAFQKRLTSIDQQGISNLQALKEHLDTQFPDLTEKIITTGFCIIIKVRMEFAKLSYEQAHQELKDLLNK